MSMQFARVVQVALGVVNAVPVERRPAIAEERLLYLATNHGFAPAPAARRDELWEAASEVLNSVEKLYHEGRLDEMLCGLPPTSPALDPLNLIDRVASRVGVGIGRENYRALATACVEALRNWAQANPEIDVDQQPSTKLRWELGLGRTLLTDLDSSIDLRHMPTPSISEVGADSPDPPAAAATAGKPSTTADDRVYDVPSGWRTHD
ncbi:MAG: hypothetical protein ABIZ69_01520 [Ilumatobacteraceae bacterium]